MDCLQLRKIQLFCLSCNFILIQAVSLRVKQSSCRSAGIFFFPPQHRILERPNLHFLSREDGAGGVRFCMALLLELGENEGLFTTLRCAYAEVESCDLESD